MSIQSLRAKSARQNNLLLGALGAGLGARREDTRASYLPSVPVCSSQSGPSSDFERRHKATSDDYLRVEPIGKWTRAFFKSAEDKRPFIQRLFSCIAHRYDAFNRIASLGLDRRWRVAAIKRGSVGPGQKVLDVCAGTGDLSLLCAAHQQGVGTVIALDMNRDMLFLARGKQIKRGVSVQWTQSDALAIPFDDETFDRVLIGFSTRNLMDLMAGLREMVRVLKPGGKLIILETGRPANLIVRWSYYAFLLSVSRIVGLILTGRAWPFTYLARSVRHFVRPKVLISCLQGIKTEVEYVPLTCGLACLFIAKKQG